MQVRNRQPRNRIAAYYGIGIRFTRRYVGNFLVIARHTAKVSCVDESSADMAACANHTCSWHRTLLCFAVGVSFLLYFYRLRMSEVAWPIVITLCHVFCGGTQVYKKLSCCVIADRTAYRAYGAPYEYR